MVAIPQLAFAKVIRSAKTKDRKIDFDFPDLSTGHLQQKFRFSFIRRQTTGKVNTQ